MKKIIVALLLLTMSSACFGAASDDVYLRKDVFEAKMESMNAKLDMLLEQMKDLREQMKNIQEEQKAMRKDLSELTTAVSVMSERIDRNFDTLSARIDGLDKRMDYQQNYLYLLLVILGIIVALPTVQKMLQGREDRKNSRKESITLEDVMRLIEQNNARMAGKIQA